MPKSARSEQVPESLQAKFTEITQLTDELCYSHLNNEYAQLCRYLTAALCRKRSSPLTSGKANTWACGIVHAIGSVNFLFDPSQTPHLKATDLYDLLGVSRSSGQSKSKQVQELMQMQPLDPDWCLPSKIDSNPLAWMVSVNGFIIDARSAPRVVQEAAYRKGLIPYLPGEEGGEEVRR